MPRNNALGVLLFFGSVASAQYKTINPQVTKIISEVSEQRITETQKKLGELRYPQYFFRPG